MHPWCTGCFPCVWEVSLTDACSPWHVGWCPSRWGSLPAGWGSVLVRYCLPIICLGLAHLGLLYPLYHKGYADTLFPFYCKGYIITMCLLAPNLFPFTTGLYLDECCVSHFARSVPNLPSKEKKLWTHLKLSINAQTCPKCSEKVLKIGWIFVQISLKNCPQFVGQKMLDSFTSDTMLKDQVEYLYLYFCIYNL